MKLIILAVFLQYYYFRQSIKFKYLQEGNTVISIQCTMYYTE